MSTVSWYHSVRQGSRGILVGYYYILLENLVYNNFEVNLFTFIRNYCETKSETRKGIIQIIFTQVNFQHQVIIQIDLTHTLHISDPTIIPLKPINPINLYHSTPRHQIPRNRNYTTKLLIRIRSRNPETVRERVKRASPSLIAIINNSPCNSGSTGSWYASRSALISRSESR